MEYFYTMSYLAPIGFIYEDGTEVTEKNYQDGFNMTKKNGFLVMIDTESLDGFLTYDYRFMKSDGARYGYPRTQAFQKKVDKVTFEIPIHQTFDHFQEACFVYMLRIFCVYLYMRCVYCLCMLCIFRVYFVIYV